MTQPRITPSMRALLECAGCLAHGTPIPLLLLHTATDGPHKREIPAALQQLIRIGYLRQVDANHVALTAAGYRFLAERLRSDQARNAVELASLIITDQYVKAQDQAGLALMAQHLAVVVDGALPRADDKAAMLAASFLLCLMTIGAADTIRDYLPRLEALEARSGYSILPDGLVERLTGRGGPAVSLSQPMFAILQSIACLDDSQPVPLALLEAIFGSRPEIEQTVAELAERGFVIRPDDQNLLLTEAGRQLRQPVEAELREGVVAGLVRITQPASEQGNRATLRQIRPHLQTMTEAALPQADDSAHHLVLALIQCLIGLDDLLLAANYVDRAHELEAALGRSTAEEETLPDGGQGVQYHTQLAVHYFQQGNYGRARLHFEEAIAAADDAELLPALYQKLGDCYGELGDESGQLVAYTTALERALAYYGRDNWQLIPYYNDLSSALIRQGSLAMAARHLDRAIRLVDAATEDSARYYREAAKAHLLAADIAYQQERLKRGREWVERAMVLTQKVGDHWLDRAHLLYGAASLFYRNGRRRAARTLIQQAQEICQNRLDSGVREAARITALIADLDKQLAGSL